MTRLRLSDLVRSSATSAVADQRPDGSFSPGHNGPYGDRDTPVRNTAHWLVTLCRLEERERNGAWNRAAHAATDYLLSDEARPHAASFFCRSGSRRDRCNGLVGQAWVIEALVEAARALGRDDAAALAREVFHLHPFIERRGLWRRIEVDGGRLPPDPTFNHQLWFAAAAGLLRDEDADRRSLRFLDRVGSGVQLTDAGLVRHASRLGPPDPLPYLAAPRRELRTAVARWRAKRGQEAKSIGYHGFNLYAFALLSRRFPDHELWRSRRMRRMLDVTRSDGFKSALRASPYGYPYNPPGIELAFAGEVFGLGDAYVRDWLRLQAANTYDPATGDLLRRGASDELTCSARIYEATRLTGDHVIEVDGGDGL